MKSPASRFYVASIREWLTRTRIAYAVEALAVVGLCYWIISAQSARIDALVLENQKQAAIAGELAEQVVGLRAEQQTATKATQNTPARTSQNAEANAAILARMSILEGRLSAVEQHPPATPEPSQAFLSALAGHSAELKTLGAYTQKLSDRIDSLDKAAVTHPKVGAMANPGTPADLARLEQAAIAAFQTLDQQFQSILEQLETLAERDEALEQAQEASRVALQTELTQWRERHSPPIWDMAAQLSGVTIRFSEATRIADEVSAQEILQQVATLLLSAEATLGIRVVGYADFDGTDTVSNRITSQKRADYIQDQLIRLGVPKERVLAVGRSTEDRVIDSDAAGNANRRVIFEPFELQDTNG